jgi:predicted DNA-binding WGR domain protein
LENVVSLLLAPTSASAFPEFARFEFEEDESSKFWEISTSGCDVTSRWGRIGTWGRSQTKTFPDEAAATAAADRQIESKEAKGYEQVEDEELGEDIGEVLDRLGAWSRQDRVPLGNGRSDFDEEMSQEGDQYWYVDGEDMAEGDMESVLTEMVPSLRLVGLDLHVVTLMDPYDPESTGYDMSLNGIHVEMYRHDPADPKMPLCDDPWMDCTVKPLAVVNQLLGEAGSIYRIGVLCPGGNDGMAVLLPTDVWTRIGALEQLAEYDVVVP